jgi:putative tryptophan/tyrosine transport system substrate-binding protein
MQFQATEGAARRAGLKLERLRVTDGNEISVAIEGAARRGAGALLALTSPVVNTNLDRIADLAIKHQLPAICLFTRFGELGGLLAYGADPQDLYRRAAGYVARILKGDKPAELPIQRPTKFELIINLKTAKALGITVPQSLLLRADQVIQ